MTLKFDVHHKTLKFQQRYEANFHKLKWRIKRIKHVFDMHLLKATIRNPILIHQNCTIMKNSKESLDYIDIGHSMFINFVQNVI